MLAAKLSPRTRFTSFPKIRIAGQEPTANPDRILKAFHKFFSDLYSAPSQPHGDSMTEFLDGLPIASLDTEHRDILETPFSVEEVAAVIKGLHTGSAPGPDGLSAPYYKAFADTLAPHMTKFFNFKTQGSPLGAQLNTAYITVRDLPAPNRGICVRVCTRAPFPKLNNIVCLPVCTSAPFRHMRVPYKNLTAAMVRRCFVFSSVPCYLYLIADLPIMTQLHLTLLSNPAYLTLPEPCR